MAARALSEVCLVLVAAVADRLEQAAARNEFVRVACSGGPDSLALAAAVAVCHRRFPGLMVEALVVDHQLQTGSARVAFDAVEAVQRLGLPARSVTVTVQRSADGPEAAARTARYAALSAPGGVARGNTAGDVPRQLGVPDLVLLGHTLDDQAETVLLGLARGSGTRSLAGMPAQFGAAPQFWRPLLRVRRSQTEQACADWGLKPWHDPQNRQDRFTRSRLRHRVMPVLSAELGPGIVPALARTATLAGEDADYLDELASTQLARLVTGTSLDCAGLGAQPSALRGRIMRQWLADQGIVGLDFTHTTAALSLVVAWHGQKGIDLPGGHRVVRRGGQLRVVD